jgi:hypothetical protein
LWLGIFKADIIRENVIRFDENVKYGEDFLFFVEYSRFCNRIAIVNEPLYHSVHREGSSASRLKFSIDHSMRTVYLTDEFVRIMADVEWDFKDKYIAKRYINFIPQAAILLTRTKNIKKRRKQIKLLIEKSDITTKAAECKVHVDSSLERFYWRAIYKKRAISLLAYGYTYNILRSVKRIFAGALHKNGK